MPPTAIDSPASTPPVRRKALRKPVIDSSPEASPLQPSSRHVNVPSAPTMNDDRAEKAARRKSAHFGELGENGPGRPGGAQQVGGGKRVVSALAMQQQQQNALNQSTMAKRGKRLSAVGAGPGLPILSKEKMNDNFEEWMKLTLDNKVNSNNAWNFALIDYFADMTLLKNESDQSINFQKASSTLDGCVKIWTSRVDSVATETGKLLSGLAGGGGGEEEREEGAEGEDEEGGEVQTKRKTRRSEATLAKSFEALQVKKFDLEFTVDPLFKKTSADFDEGGAMGLLMNHLSVDGKGRVVFDAGDAGVEEEDDQVVEDQEVDISKLRQYIPSADITANLKISDTLSSFRFSSDPNSIPDFSTLFGLKESFADGDPHLSGSYGEAHPTGEVQDFFGDEDFDVPGPSNYAAGFDDEASVAGDDEDRPDHFGGGIGMVAPGDSHVPFDPRRGGGELVMALAAGDEGEGMFDYFDKGLGKAWAGAEHWKLRKVSKKELASSASPSKKAPKATKAPFQIDFLSSSSAQSSKTLFAPAPRSSLNMPSSSRSSSKKSKQSRDARKRKEEWLLPDDMHFSSRQLLRLFLKPKFSLRVRRNASTARIAENPDADIDENFWAQAAAERAEIGENEDIDTGSMPIPFESQFFHDDGDVDDEGYVDDNLDTSATFGGTALPPGEEADDLLAGTQGTELKKSKPENVNFAKRAKRIDVKRLKDDIWSGLKSLVPEPNPDPDDQSKRPPPSTEAGEAEPAEESKTFDSIITSLRTTYPREKMSELSTSFCFICLLHLANEEGLRLETARFDGKDGEDVGCMGMADVKEVDEEGGGGKRRRLDEGERVDRVVGELQALKVWKDLEAGRGA